MATTIYEQEKVKLFSGKELTLRPLKISVLRDFMKEFENIGEAASDNVQSLEVVMNCVQIAMRQYAPELSEDRESLEDEIDLPTAYKVIEVGSGIKLTDDEGN